MEYKPYTYLIGWSKLNKWYYGSEYGFKSKTANPNNLWKTYFTSSKAVQDLREEYGEPDIIEVRKIFNTAEDTIKWEQKVLSRLHQKDPFNSLQSRWINSNVSGAILLNEEQISARISKMKITISREDYIKWNKGQNKETHDGCAKASQKLKNRSKSEEHKRKIGNGNRGRKKSDTSKMGKYERTPEIISKMLESKGEFHHSEETKKRVSEKLKGRIPPNKGIKASLESREKMSDSRKGKASHKKGKKKYTNGEVNKFFFKDQQPEGWYLVHPNSV